MQTRPLLRSMRVILALALLFPIAACDSWARSAREAEQIRNDPAFSTTSIDVGNPAVVPDTAAPSTTTTVVTTTAATSPSTTEAVTPPTLAPARVVPAAPATTAPPAPTTTLRTVPVPPPPPTTTISTTTTVASTPVGWIAVLASLSTANYTRQAAADWRLELGLPGAEILLSNDYSTLTPGYWVLYEGRFQTKDQAVAACTQRAATVPGCYPAALNLSS